MTAHIIDGLLDCIMLVDDNESTNFYNSIVIQKAGLHVHVQEVINGMDALNYLMGKGSFSGHTPPYRSLELSSWISICLAWMGGSFCRNIKISPQTEDRGSLSIY